LSKILEKRGFTLTDILIAVTIIGLLTAVGVPTYLKARETTLRNRCLTYQYALETVIEGWTGQYMKKQTDLVTWQDLFDADYMQFRLSCPRLWTQDYLPPGFRIASEVSCAYISGDGKTNHVRPR
jgi:prepilin-type N-terminal cleavage/methylation domain-containing protein